MSPLSTAVNKYVFTAYLRRNSITVNGPCPGRAANFAALRSRFLIRALHGDTTAALIVFLASAALAVRVNLSPRHCEHSRPGLTHFLANRR
jgi:hypothetical protein